MNNELIKRVKTSIVLSILLLFSLFINKTIFVISLIIITAISCKELWAMINKIIKKGKIIEFIINILILCYFTIFFLSSYKIYDEYGSLYFLYILLICIFSDLGGYIIGKNIGGIKLTKISPKKTISGSIGSFIFSLIPLLLFNYYGEINSLLLKDFIIVLSVSFICQLGDLFVSYIKRKANLKDTGDILPGHGGFLDRIDGVIFVIPYVYLIILNNLFF